MRSLLPSKKKLEIKLQGKIGIDTHIVVLLGDNGPIDKSNHLLNNSFYPCLEEREFFRYSINLSLRCSEIIQIRLVEHEGVVMQAEKMTGIGIFLELQECVPITVASRSIDPFQDGAWRQLTLHHVSRQEMRVRASRKILTL